MPGLSTGHAFVGTGSFVGFTPGLFKCLFIVSCSFNFGKPKPRKPAVKARDNVSKLAAMFLA